LTGLRKKSLSITRSKQFSPAECCQVTGLEKADIGLVGGTGISTFETTFWSAKEKLAHNAKEVGALTL